MHRVDDLLAPAVGDSDRQRHLAIGGGGLLGLTDRGDHRVRQEIELADGADPDAETADPRVTGELDELGLDARQDPDDFARIPAKVIRREGPEAHRGGRQLGAPEEHVVELPRAQRVRLARVDEAALERVPAVARGGGGPGPPGRASPDLPKETAPAEGGEERDHQTSPAAGHPPPPPPAYAK